MQSRKARQELKLHTVLVSYRRRELTQISLESYLATVTVPFSLLVVDNGSDEETQAWLREQTLANVLFLGENRFPGFATNRGWEQAPDDATHLHRADNDFRFLAGWSREVVKRFRDPRLGQLGLRTDSEELYAAFNVGGNCVIRRELWDQGLRYDERPWGEYPPGYTEDSYMSPQVERMGWKWLRVRKPCIQSLASGDWNDPYYQWSYGVRGIRRHGEEPKGPSSTHAHGEC